MSSIRDQVSEERKRFQAEGIVPLWMNTAGYGLFKQKYSVVGENSFRGRAETIAATAAKYVVKHGQDYEVWKQKFFNLIWNGWLSCSTPILSNMGTNKGYSVSCSGQYIGDSVDDFYTNLHEGAMLSKMGFGTSAYLGDIRPRGTPISAGGKATGLFPVFEDFVTMASKVSQGGTRRGSWAGYVPITHPDFMEVYNYIYNKPDEVNMGVTWTDADTAAMDAKDPKITSLFKKLMKLRATQGKGYLVFPDKANRQAPQMYKDHNLRVQSSNLCSEIFLFQDQDHSYTCVLASMNLFMYDQWKDTSAIFDATVFLDCVAEDFIQNAKGKAGFEKSVRFTEKGRALGLGVCGYHSYLQDHMMAFESLDALFFNQMFFKELHDKSLDASQWMAKEFGEPEWCKGYGVRNTHRTAIAPTMSTSQIMGGISQGIEPMQGCCFVQTSSGGEEERINPIFLKLMKSRGKNNKKIQKDIMDNYGSCQHLDWVTDEEKLVFRTAPEIDQTVIIRQASQRQRWICQGQSLNLFVYSSTPAKHIAYLHKLIIKDEWIKGAYYLRGQAGVSASLGCVACQ